MDIICSEQAFVYPCSPTCLILYTRSNDVSLSLLSKLTSCYCLHGRVNEDIQSLLRHHYITKINYQHKFMFHRVSINFCCYCYFSPTGYSGCYRCRGVERTLPASARHLQILHPFLGRHGEM